MDANRWYYGFYWSEEKIEVYEEYGGAQSYDIECFDHWTDKNGDFKFEGDTGSVKYGNNCAAPEGHLCPILFV